MKLAELEARGGMVDPTLVKKNITWVKKDADGKEESLNFDIFVRRSSFGIIDSLIGSDDRSQRSMLIAQAIRLGDHGEEAIPYEKAYGLEPSLANAMMEAFIEVNKLGKTESKN